MIRVFIKDRAYHSVEKINDKGFIGISEANKKVQVYYDQL